MIYNFCLFKVCKKFIKWYLPSSTSKIAAPINRYVKVTTIKDSVLTFLLFIFLIYTSWRSKIHNLVKNMFRFFLMKDFFPFRFFEMVIMEMRLITVYKRKTHSEYHFHQLPIILLFVEFCIVRKNEARSLLMSVMFSVHLSIHP